MASPHRTAIPASTRKASRHTKPLLRPAPRLALASFLSAIAAAGFLASRALLKNRRSAFKPEGKNINKESTTDCPSQFVRIKGEGSQLAQKAKAMDSLEDFGKASSDLFSENNEHNHDHCYELNCQRTWNTQETREGLDHGEHEGKENSVGYLFDDGFSQNPNCNAANHLSQVVTGDQEGAAIFVIPPDHENGTNGNITCNAKRKEQCNLDSGKGLNSEVDGHALSANAPNAENDQNEEHNLPENASASAEFNFISSHKQGQSAIENQDTAKAAFSNLTLSSQAVDVCFIEASECTAWVECVDYKKLGSIIKANGTSQALPAPLLTNEECQQSITGEESLDEQKTSLLGTCNNLELDNLLDSEEEMSNVSTDDVQSESSAQEVTSAAVNPLDLSPVEEVRSQLDKITPVDNLPFVAGLTKMPERKNEDCLMHGCKVNCKIPTHEIEAEGASGCEAGYITAGVKDSAIEPPKCTITSLSVSTRDPELNQGANLQIAEPQNGSGRESGIIAVSSISCEKSKKKLISLSLYDRKNSDTDFKFDDFHVENVQPLGHASARCENTKNQVLNHHPVNEIEIEVEKPEIVCAQNQLHSSFDSSIQRRQYEKRRELESMSFSKPKTCESAGANLVGPLDMTDQSSEPEFRGAAVMTHARGIPYLTTEVLIICVLIGLVSLVFYSLSFHTSAH